MARFEPSGRDFKKLAAYVKYLKTNFNRSPIIRPGFFYAYYYNLWRSEDFKRKPYNVVKFYDFYPLIFCYEIYKDKSGNILARGINFHHLPPRVRSLWLGRVNKLSDLSEDKRQIKLMAWGRLFKIYRRASKAMVRQYDLKLVRQSRRIPTTALPKIMRFVANSYFGVNISAIRAKYLLTKV